MPFEQVRDIICKQLELEESDVTMDTNIKDDLGADSLDLVDLAISLEDEFEVEVPDNILEKFETVGDIVKFIEEM
ncbi:MAG: acyl carrier protein [Clostridia bacterium]|nr:acyl carrier protein [Clostridia bacterium]MBR6619445.1 acyl carrier protein [Clostridia bacterium]